MSTTARLENRRCGADDRGNGPSDGGGATPGQLSVLFGAGIQVCAHRVLTS